MKLERLSENQIRCTLYKSDLSDKELMLSELAYGTDKAKELFRELMQQASEELGFEVDNVPLMIEAIPVSSECLILVITKVEDPEELDTRFSRFTRPVDVDVDAEMEDEDSSIPSVSKATDGLLEALGGLVEGISGALGVERAKGNEKAKAGKDKEPEAQPEVFRIYAFKSLYQVILSAKLVKNMYNSTNSLYKNPKDSQFYLYMTKDEDSESDFNRTCNIINEYSHRVRASYATPHHMEEHYKVIIRTCALQKLSEV